MYLPCLQARCRLSFRQVSPRSHLSVNRFGIPEPPRKATTIDAHALDVVIVPLVAFDPAGRRLGMGGGYYDRSFAFKRQFPQRGPVLIGLAHSCQEVAQLTAQAWDVPLDWIVTEKKIMRGDAGKKR